jgi:DNA-binding NarL/FixJ family response regulator
MTEKTSPLKVLIVDDHQMFLDGLKTLLSKHNSIEVVGEALNGLQALEIIRSKPVDLVLSDINMPEMSGTELTKAIKEEKPEIKILILSMYNDREIIHEIVMTEAEGYILKNSNKQELIKALERIGSGGTYYSNEVMEIITDSYVAKQKSQEKLKDITKREIEIIQLICQEYSTPEIAEALFISPLTVETHRKNILKKTKVRTIVGLIKFAIDNKIA